MPHSPLKADPNQPSLQKHRITPEHINICPRCAKDMRRLLSKEGLAKLDFEAIGKKLYLRKDPNLFERLSGPVTFSFMAAALLGGFYATYVFVFKKQ